MTIHIVKLCVGAESVDDLADWQARLMRRQDRPSHHTRMTPRRAEEVLRGGSIYWVIRRAIRVRQRIVDIRTHEGEDGRSMCELVFDPELVAVQPRRKRPFQGWRYLKPGDAPPDLDTGQPVPNVPADLDEALKAALVW